MQKAFVSSYVASLPATCACGSPIRHVDARLQLLAGQSETDLQHRCCTACLKYALMTWLVSMKGVAASWFAIFRAFLMVSTGEQLLLIFWYVAEADMNLVCRYGAGKVSSGANVEGAPLPEDIEENGKEEEVGEFGFNTLVGLPVIDWSSSSTS